MSLGRTALALALHVVPDTRQHLTTRVCAVSPNNLLSFTGAQSDGDLALDVVSLQAMSAALESGASA